MHILFLALKNGVFIEQKDLIFRSLTIVFSNINYLFKKITFLFIKKNFPFEILNDVSQSSGCTSLSLITPNKLINKLWNQEGPSHVFSQRQAFMCASSSVEAGTNLNQVLVQNLHLKTCGIWARSFTSWLEALRLCCFFL